jgi:hypothetical protein
MKDLVASVLASLASSYAAQDADPIDPSFLPTPEEQVIGRNIDRATAKALVSGVVPSTATPSPTAARPENGFQASPISHVPGPKSEPLPKAGSLEAAGFLKAMRNAGVRKGKLDMSVKREDEQRAIAAYIGYNEAELHGPQEVSARMRAQRELNPITVNKDEVWHRNGTASNSVAGYVAGTYDATAKAVANLKAQEVIAAENLCAHRNVLMDNSKSLDERATASLLVKLEEERLTQIRKDLAALGEKV